MPRISHQIESSLYVDDLDRSAAFYERVLGFEPLLHDSRMVALAVPGGSVLLLFRRGESAQPRQVPGGVIPGHDGGGTQHLAFGIPVAALEHWERHLPEQEVEIESRVTQTFGGVSLYFRDLDGHSVEVATPGLWAVF